jgi:hypothetical protein
VLSGKTNVGSSKVLEQPNIDLFLGAFEAKFSAVGPNILCERASSSSSSVVLTGESWRIGGLPNPQPILFMKKQIHAHFITQWKWTGMRPPLELKMDWGWDNSLNSMDLAKLTKKFSELFFHVNFIPNGTKVPNLPAAVWSCNGWHYRCHQSMLA